MKEKNLARIRKNNIKLYPIYKMVGLDWMFYYGIKVLFLTQVKSISPADIILSTSFYAFCYILFQVFNTVLVGKIGKRNAIVVGQTLNFISMLLIMWCPNLIVLLISQAIFALGFGLKDISESSFLATSIPKSSEKGEIFSKVDSKGYSKFCFLGATSVLISGFLYAINPYIPIILCLATNLLAIIISLNFIDIEKIDNKKEKNNLNVEVHNILDDLKDGFKFIFHSRRLRTLLVFLGLLWGFISTYATYQETLLKDLEIPSYYIGFILAGFQLLVGIFSTTSNSFNKRFRNHVLTYIGLMLTLGSILLGVITIFDIPFPIQLMAITAVFIARAYAKGVYQVLKNRYMNNFANNSIIAKIYSIYGILSNISCMIIGVMASAILKSTSLNYALLILGIICTAIIVLMSIFSKSRLGLKPEEYSKDEIFE